MILGSFTYLVATDLLGPSLSEPYSNSGSLQLFRTAARQLCTSLLFFFWLILPQVEPAQLGTVLIEIWNISLSTWQLGSHGCLFSLTLEGLLHYGTGLQMSKLGCQFIQHVMLSLLVSFNHVQSWGLSGSLLLFWTKAKFMKNGALAHPIMIVILAPSEPSGLDVVLPLRLLLQSGSCFHHASLPRLDGRHIRLSKIVTNNLYYSAMHYIT